MTVSDTDRDAAVAALRATDTIWDRGHAIGYWVAPMPDEARRVVAALIDHDWGPLGELRHERDQLTRALLAVLYELHPIEGSTSRTGLGGASVTQFCDLVRPISEAAEQLRSIVDTVVRGQLRRMEREGYAWQSIELQEVPGD